MPALLNTQQASLSLEVDDGLQQPAGEQQPPSPQQSPGGAQDAAALSQQLDGGLSLEWEASSPEAAGAASRQQSPDWQQQQQQADGAAAAAAAATPERQQSGAAPADQQQQQAEEAEEATPQRDLSGPVASPKAIGAVWELVQCCVGAQPLPPSVADPLSPPGGMPRVPGVRWYDARARVALLQVASWLQVRARLGAGERPLAVSPRTTCHLELLPVLHVSRRLPWF